MNEHVSPNNSYPQPVWLFKHALNGPQRNHIPASQGLRTFRGHACVQTSLTLFIQSLPLMCFQSQAEAGVNKEE